MSLCSRLFSSLSELRWLAGLSLLATSLLPAQPVQPVPPVPPEPASEETLLATVTAPPEFDVTLFATSDQVNYPVSVAAAPDGTLYVASDANSSLGTELGRGRIMRLRDTTGDGRADEVKTFARVDSPRGLVWDGDRLYVMHPPHLSVFIDHDGNGESDEQQILVKDIAFSFRDRPADHTSNGVTLGVDGWLYLAIGDFGFMEAEGTDGRKLQLRAGGVVRVRPDGTGLELYARGTRNTLEIALSPRLDGFARDNTNDGDGWDTRLHHFAALGEHGYPTLYRNFPDEAIAPLADYGTGAACGALWLDEPGIPARWNGAPFTADWGREAVYRHELTPSGATFTTNQEEFAKLPRVTDLDVDAQSRLYIASWREGRYNFSGPDVGFITRFTPKDHQPVPLPDFAKATGAGLVQLLLSPSTRTRLEAQRTLLRRGLTSEVTALEALASSTATPLNSRIIALFTLKQGLGEASHPFLAGLFADPSIAAWAIRALADHKDQLGSVPVEPLLAGLRSSDARTRRESLFALSRLGDAGNAPAMAALLGDSDPIVAHVAVKALVSLQASAPAFAIVDDVNATPARRLGALQVIQALHNESVVKQVITRLNREPDAERREDLVRVLARLHNIEGTWTGDSWGTRPDTRGPYYQPDAWAASSRINEVLKEQMDQASGAGAARLNEIFTLHRLTPGDPIGRLMQLAQTDDSLLPTLAQHLSTAVSVPPEAIPLLQRALTWVPPASPTEKGPGVPDPGPTQLAAMQALIRAGTAETIEIALHTLPTLSNRGRLGDGVRDKAANAFFLSTALEDHYRFLATEAAKLDGATSAWADAALLHLGARRFGAIEPRDYANRVLDEGWNHPARRVQIIKASALGRETSRAEDIVLALDDPDPAVVEAATSSIAALRIDADSIRAGMAIETPLLATLDQDEILDRVVHERGLISRGEQVYAQAGCMACHTVDRSESIKGPYLGTIASLYPRRELAESIIDPHRTIAQGFVTYQFTMRDGSTRLGFVVRESPHSVSIRDIAGQEHEVVLSEVAQRERLPISLMPPGLMSNFTLHDFASLLDYLASLAAQQN